VTVEGREINVPEGASAAAAFLLAGFASIRDTSVNGTSRAPYCMMGICFDCLAEIDGIPNRQACMVSVVPGMTIHRQHGKRAVEIE
jgi:D-hydroxyproline dehydrogenase subunit gamma